MHLLLAVSLLSLFVLPGCWNPFKSDKMENCGCDQNAPAECQDVCAPECAQPDMQDPMVDGAGVTDESDYTTKQ